MSNQPTGSEQMRSRGEAQHQRASSSVVRGSALCGAAQYIGLGCSVLAFRWEYKQVLVWRCGMASPKPAALSTGDMLIGAHFAPSRNRASSAGSNKSLLQIRVGLNRPFRTNDLTV
jgi:hypothetical protein